MRAHILVPPSNDRVTNESFNLSCCNLKPLKCHYCLFHQSTVQQINHWIIKKKNHTASLFCRRGYLLSIQRIHNKHLTRPHNELHIVDNTKHTVCLQCLREKMDGGWIIICPTVINTLWSHDQCWRACLLQAIYHSMRG